jgi:outer membrane PBP1 activator LpoA protein
MPKKKVTLLDWIDAQLKEAKKYRDEADAAREESNYTDIDALEQARYNEGVINVLTGLKEELKKGLKP